MKNNSNTALLVMDMQSGILQMYPQAETLVSNVKKTVDYARSNDIPVIYVVVTFRQGLPEISPNNKSFSAAKERWANQDMSKWAEVHPDLAPQAGEVTVAKRRVSAFTGSDLEVVLRAKEIGHVILTGIATSGVVLSTLREAADKDYRITVLADGCGDNDEEVHRVLTTKVFTRQADVVSVDEWIS